MVAMNFSCFGTLFLFYVNMWIYLVSPFFADKLETWKCLDLQILENQRITQLG
jgi:hypothetical protein